MDSSVSKDVLRSSRLSVALAVFLTVLPAVIVFLWHASRYGSWLIDDAGITYAYARNLAAGYGLVSQPGQAAVEGFSNPLWTLLTALLYFLKLFSIPFTPKVLAFCLVVASFVVFAMSVRQLIPAVDAGAVAGCALVLTAANPGFVIWCVSGLENPLLVLLAAFLLLMAARALREEAGSQFGISLCAGLLSAALALTRPDGLIYAIFFPLALLLRTGSDEPGVVAKSLGVYGISMALPFGAYLLFRHIYFGEWVPNTYYAKPGVSIAAIFDLANLNGVGAAKFAELAAGIFGPLPFLVPTALFAVLACLVLARHREMVPRLLLLGGFAALAFIAYLVLPPDWMGEYRFASVAFPASYLLGFLLVREVLVAAQRPSARTATLALAGAVALVTASTGFLERAMVFRDHPTVPLEQVGQEAWKVNQLAAQLSLRDPTLLLPDLGGTLLLGKQRIVDVAGLCDRAIARFYHDGKPPVEFARYILHEVKPDLVHIHGYWARRSGLLQSQEFLAAYINVDDGYYVRRASLPRGMADAQARLIRSRLRDESVEADVRSALAKRGAELDNSAGVRTSSATPRAGDVGCARAEHCGIRLRRASHA